MLYHARLDQLGDQFEGAVTEVYARQRDAGEIEPDFSERQLEPWIFKSLRFREFATCWHASEYESDALWKLYASGGAGVAVVSTMGRLERSVDLAPYRGILGQVEYVDFESHDMRHRPFGTVMRPGHLKRRSFEHEREVRGLVLTNLIKDGATLTMDDRCLERQRAEQPLGIGAKVDLAGLIESIVISPMATSYVEELVDIIAKRHGLDHLVRKSDLLRAPVF